VARPKILLIIIHNHYFNYYFQKNLFLKLSKYYDVRFIVPEDIFYMVPDYFKSYTDTLSNDLLHYKQKSFTLISDVYRWKFRKKSKSFYFREKRFAHPFTFYSCYAISMTKIKNFKSSFKLFNKKNVIDNFNSVKPINDKTILLKSNKYPLALHIKWFFRATILRFFIRTISHEPLFTIFNYLIIKRISFPKKLYDIILANSSDLVIFPSSAYESLGLQLTLIQKHLKSPILFLIDNWDNLSSKSIIWERPDFVATWSEQSKQHACEIQGFSQEQVFILGTARFSNYADLRKVKIDSNFDFDYILFLGTSLPFNEIKCLEIINSEIKKHRSIYKNLVIVYRPHPYGINIKNKISVDHLEFVIIDPEVNSNFDEFTSIEYFPLILKNAKVVIGGLTSMLIEASIFGKNIVALAHKEKYNIASPHKMYQNYEHVQGIEKLPNLALCESLDNLPDLFRRAFTNLEISQELIDKELDFFYNITGETYEYKLQHIIEKILLSGN
jgi:hypothetical protein